DVGPHPVRPGEAAPRGHLRRRADPRRRSAKHPNPGTKNVQLVGVSRSFGVSRGECAACEKGHPRSRRSSTTALLRPTRLHLPAPGLYLGAPTSPQPGLYLSPPGDYLSPPGLYLSAPRLYLGLPGRARARPVLPGGPSSNDGLLQRQAVPSTAVRRS